MTKHAESDSGFDRFFDDHGPQRSALDDVADNTEKIARYTFDVKDAAGSIDVTLREHHDQLVSVYVAPMYGKLTLIAKRLEHITWLLFAVLLVLVARLF